MTLSRVHEDPWERIHHPHGHVFCETPVISLLYFSPAYEDLFEKIHHPHGFVFRETPVISLLYFSPAYEDLFEKIHHPHGCVFGHIDQPIRPNGEESQSKSKSNASAVAISYGSVLCFLGRDSPATRLVPTLWTRNASQIVYVFEPGPHLDQTVSTGW